MPTIEESIVIAAPPERVFDYLLDPASFAQFSGSILYSELEGEGPLRVGSRIKGATKVLGRTVEWVVECTDLDRPNKLATRSVEGQIDLSTAYMMAPQGEGTHLTYRLETAAGLGGVFGRLADAVVNRVYERQVRADLATLAEILTEHGPSGH